MDIYFVELQNYVRIYCAFQFNMIFKNTYILLLSFTYFVIAINESNYIICSALCF